jgi:hypothetical protein
MYDKNIRPEIDAYIYIKKLAHESYSWEDGFGSHIFWVHQRRDTWENHFRVGRTGNTSNRVFVVDQPVLSTNSPYRWHIEIPATTGPINSAWAYSTIWVGHQQYHGVRETRRIQIMNESTLEAGSGPELVTVTSRPTYVNFLLIKLIMRLRVACVHSSLSKNKYLIIKDTSCDWSLYLFLTLFSVSSIGYLTASVV